MKQPVVAGRPRVELTRVERAIIGVNLMLAAAFGIVGFIGADDPNWRGLQRLAVMTLVVLWLAGLGAAVLGGRYIEQRWVRSTLLAAAPVGVLLVFLALIRL